MDRFWGIVRYEYWMCLRRWGVWLAMGLAGLWALLAALDMIWEPGSTHCSMGAGILALNCNFVMPVVGGIIVADRLVRDRRLGVRELLRATPLAHSTYVLAKYVAAVLAVLTPVLAIMLAAAGLGMARGWPAALLGQAVLAFLAINVPAFAFVGAFSLACPEVMPVRAYQILFTGYWVWGNFLTPKFVPTLNGTLLTAKGDFAASAFFGVGRFVSGHTVGEALLNLATLGACAALALLAVGRYLAWQERRV